MSAFTETGFDSSREDNPPSSNRSNESYTLDQGQIESLRVELSTISSDKQQEIQEFVQHVQAEFLDQYQPFLSETKTDQDISQRVIVTDNQTLSNFPEVWSKNDLGEVRCVGDYEETYGKFIVVTGESSWYWQQLDSEQQSALTEHHGSEQAAQEYAQEWGMANTLIHELIHHYQPEYLYDYEMLVEGSAVALEIQMANHLGIAAFPDSLRRPEYLAFISTQQQIGSDGAGRDRTLKVLLGRDSNPDAIQAIAQVFASHYRQALQE